MQGTWKRPREACCISCQGPEGLLGIWDVLREQSESALVFTCGVRLKRPDFCFSKNGIPVPKRAGIVSTIHMAYACVF